ncbi:APC family permease [Mycoplasmatota bacterium]|nr:APC family permease [Mycoplasmatota bacterium]
MNKSLSKLEVFSIVLGAIIGWGAFMLPGTKFLSTGGVINTGIGLFLGALCIIGIEPSYHIMIQNTNEGGGEFSYVNKHMGSNHGFIVGWFLSLAYLTMIPLNASAFPLVINKLFYGVLNFGYLYTVAGDPVYVGEILVSFIIVIIFMSINLKGIKETGRVQMFIILGLISCVLIIFIGMIFNTDGYQFKETYISNYQFDLSQILKVLAITPFLYVGFDAIPQLVNNLHFDRKKATILAVVSLLMGMLIYNILNITTALAYTPKQILTLDWALGSGVLTNIGMIGFILLILALSAAVSSGINGFMICSTKLIGAMGKHKVLPYEFSQTNKNGSLNIAIIFVTIISFFATLFGREVIIWIVDMSSLGAAIAYFYVCYVTIKIYNNKPSIKIKGIIGMVISLFFIFLLLAPFSTAHLSMPSLIALITWSIIGLIFWYRRKTRVY